MTLDDGASRFHARACHAVCSLLRQLEDLPSFAEAKGMNCAEGLDVRLHLIQMDAGEVTTIGYADGRGYVDVECKSVLSCWPLCAFKARLAGHLFKSDLLSACEGK